MGQCGEGQPAKSLAASQPPLCLLIGIGGFMVRQRKSHTRVKKGPAAQAEVLSGDGQPDEGETGEGSSGAWEQVGVPAPSDSFREARGWGLTLGAKRVVGREGRKHLRAELEQHVQCPQGG